MKKGLGDKARLTHILEAIGLRHVLVHQYYEVNQQLIWGIVSNDLPTFKNQIEKIYQEL